MTSGDDQMTPPARAATLEDAGNRFLEGSNGSGICSEDFLLLCDKHGVKLSNSLRTYIATSVLRVTINSIATSGTVRGLSATRAMKALAEKLLGIVSDNELKLRVDMIPKPLHKQNLRTLLGSRKWSALRAEILAERDNVCEVCRIRPSSSSGLHAHEVWAYNLKKKPAVALLSRIGLLCPLCHGVEHLANSMLLIREGAHPQTYLDTLREHFTRVNGVGNAMWEKHVAQAFEAWEKISKRKDWQLDLGQFSGLVENPTASGGGSL